MSRMRQCGARGGHFRDFHVERFDALLGERANPRAVVLRLEFQQFADFLQRKTRRLRRADEFQPAKVILRSEEHTSELQSLMRISYAVFCLKQTTRKHQPHTDTPY